MAARQWQCTRKLSLLMLICARGVVVIWEAKLKPGSLSDAFFFERKSF
jgi:hypothetical protein